MAKTQARAGYSAKDITVLEGLEPVRLRPGMYIGSTGIRGLHHLVSEVVDNAVDEALAGYNDSVEITIHPDNSVTVRDQGRVIPVDVIPEQGISALEVVLTKLHAGGKFGGEGYKVSGGLHGVGVSVVNALAESLTVDVYRQGFHWQQSFARGDATGPLQKLEPSDRSGTKVTYLADAEIFEDTTYDFDTLAQRMREMAFLTAGLRLTLRDERGEPREQSFFFEGGIADFVRHINATKEPVHPNVVYFSTESEDG